MEIKLLSSRLITQIMRVTVVQLVFSLSFLGVVVAGEVHSQDLTLAHPSLDLKELTLKNAIKELEKNSNATFIYSNALFSQVSQDETISISLKNIDFATALDKIFLPLGINYRISGKHVVLTRNAGKIPGVALPTEKFDDLRITGTVRDEQAEALPGVSVVLKGTTRGTITELDGSFSIDVPEVGSILVFSFVGYETQEIIIGEQKELQVMLKTDEKALDEVVVVGYGTQNKRDVTGSVGSLKLDTDLQSRPMVEFGQAMSGKLPGIQVISGNGRPGSSTSIQVRGINSISANSAPLIVIDGNPLPNYDLNLINPSDIQSIEVLKDAASASIFGSRGANGVVLVTTKSGQSGKAKLTLNYSFGLQEVIDYVDVMNSSEYAQASIDAAQNGWIEAGGDPNAPNNIETRKFYKYTWPTALETPEKLPNTNWQDLIFRTAPMQKVDLGLSGGNEKVNYRISAGYVDQKGIVITSDYKKYSLNFKLSSRLNKWAEIGGMVNTVYDYENQPYPRIVEWAVQYPSIYPVYGNNGYLGEPNTVDGFGNYNAILFRAFNGHPLYRINDKIQHYRFNGLGNLFADFDILPGLKFKTTLNIYYRRIDDSNYESRDHNMGPNVQTEGIMTVDQARRTNYNVQNILTYDKSLNDHNISAMIGQEFFKDNFYSIRSQGRGYKNDLIPYLSAAEKVTVASDIATERTLISYFSRVNYSFKDKYIVSASLRRDGSSRFGPGNKWGYFPSASMAWYISDEFFLKKSKLISDMKLRASYGFTGNDQFADYRWISPLDQDRVAFGNYQTLAYYSSGITNPNLAWERSRQLNFGLDFGAFDNRIYFEGDFYIARSDGLLLNVPIPSYTGFTGIFKNIGKLKNKGIELSLTTRNLTGKLEWTTQMNISANRNEILELGPGDAPLIFRAVGDFVYGTMQMINQVGQPVNSFYGYQYLGVYKNQQEIDGDPTRYNTAVPGDGKYKDINGDGQLNADDRTIIGNTNPDFIWGMTNTFRYKNWDLSFVFQGVHGNEIYDENIARSKVYHEGRNYLKDVNQRWRSETEPGDGEQYKLTVNLDGFEKQPSNFLLVDGSYARLKSLTLGYAVPQKIIERMRLSSIRLYFSGQNLFTIKNNPLFDPENYNGDATNASQRGVSHAAYPTAKLYTLGVNINF